MQVHFEPSRLQAAPLVDAYEAVLPQQRQRLAPGERAAHRPGVQPVAEQGRA